MLSDNVKSRPRFQVISSMSRAFLIWGVLVLSGRAFAADPDPRALVSAVVRNEIVAARDDHTLWRQVTIQDTTEGEKSYEEVQTTGGHIRRLCAINGRPLNDEQRAKEDRRIAELLNAPGAQRKLLADEQKDAERAREMFQMFPEAFDYQYAGDERGITKLTFTPNPEFDPPSREGQVLHALGGTMWVDAEQKRLVRVEGHLVSEVKFGWGLLGHLDPGGTFLVEQREVGPGHWEITKLDVRMKGKALLFKSINVQQREIRSHFQRVEDSTSLAKGAELLRQQPQSIVAGISGR